MKQLGKTAAFWAGLILLWELIFHITVYGGLSLRFLGVIGFSLAAAAVLTLLSHLWKSPLANKITRFVLLTVILLIFGVQTVYFKVFGSLMSLAYAAIGGEVIGGFFSLVISGILVSLLQLVLYLLAYPVLAVLQHRGILDCGRASLKPWLLVLSVGFLAFALSIPARSAEGRGAVYYDAMASVDRQTERFGLLTAERLDIWRLISNDTGLSGDVVDLTGGGDTDRNIMPEIDFNTLRRSADNETLQTLTDYFSQLSGTAKNEYTGMFEGYNLIEICAESFSPYLVSEELTPTLYKLTHEGFVFENFYSSFPNVTTNGEYTLCMGIMPDLARLSFASSLDNYIPFTLGYRFQATGIQPLAYHNNSAYQYNRVNTHPHMGYDFRAIGLGLDMEAGRPASDLEMMEKTLDDYIHDESFMVHYMTYSGHNPYNFTGNDMAIKNQDRVADLDCAEDVKAFIACQLELEDAVTYLLRQLEEEGIADHTVIVLTGDHLPYALTDAGYEELAGDAVSEPFWRYRNSFVCWCVGMEETIYIDDYCCTQDILPTICNLFALPYDSRLLTGTDILSDSTHIALIQDGSFLSKDMIYNSDTGEITWLTPEEEHPEGYAQQLIQATRNLFSISASILRSDYYRFAFTTLGLADTQAEQGSNYVSTSDIIGTWYEEAAGRLARLGIVSGADSGGHFLGGEPATRAAYLTMITRALLLETPEDDPPYTDAVPGTWYYPIVARAWAAGLLPEGDETCRPHADTTIQEAREILYAAAVYIGIRDAESWAEQTVDHALALAAENGEDTETVLLRSVAAVLTSDLIDAAEEIGYLD